MACFKHILYQGSSLFFQAIAQIILFAGGIIQSLLLQLASTISVLLNQIGEFIQNSWRTGTSNDGDTRTEWLLIIGLYLLMRRGASSSTIWIFVLIYVLLFSNLNRYPVFRIIVAFIVVYRLDQRYYDGRVFGGVTLFFASLFSSPDNTSPSPKHRQRTRVVPKDDSGPSSSSRRRTGRRVSFSDHEDEVEVEYTYDDDDDDHHLAPAAPSTRSHDELPEDERLFK